jgi:hypothetical protein
MSLKRDIPSYVRVRGCQVHASYFRQPKTCQICGSEEHLRTDCPTRGKPRSSYASRLRGEPTTPIFFNGRKGDGEGGFECPQVDGERETWDGASALGESKNASGDTPSITCVVSLGKGPAGRSAGSQSPAGVGQPAVDNVASESSSGSTPAAVNNSRSLASQTGPPAGGEGSGSTPGPRALSLVAVVHRKIAHFVIEA